MFGRIGKIRKKEFFPSGGFYYRVSGHGKPQPLLFLHGLGGSPYSFKAVIELLSRKFFVVAPYMSAKWEKYKIRDFSDSNFEILADFLARLIDELKIEKPIVVGYSMGGLLAVKLAVKYPEKIKGLVIVDGLVITPNKTLWQLARLFFGKTTKRIFTVKGFKTFIGKYLDFMKNISFHPLVFINQAIYCSKADEECRICNLDTRTLILWGDKDKLLPLELALKMKNIIKNSELEKVEGGDHLWGISNPEILFEKVAKFSEDL